MKSQLQSVALAVALLASVPASSSTSDSALPPQRIALRVSVDATGKVTSVRPADSHIQPEMNRVADAFARNLPFNPARKDGNAVPSETTLTLVLALQPIGGGRFSPRLLRAFNGPGLLRAHKAEPPKYSGRRGRALIVVAVNVDAEGLPDPASQTTERVQLHEPNKFAEARYLDAVSIAVRGSQFELDRVNGEVVPSRVSVPYPFGAWTGKPKDVGEDEGRGGKRPAVDVNEVPAISAVSLVPGIELAKIDYRAPDIAVPPAK